MLETTQLQLFISGIKLHSQSTLFYHYSFYENHLGVSEVQSPAFI